MLGIRINKYISTSEDLHLIKVEDEHKYPRRMFTCTYPDVRKMCEEPEAIIRALIEGVDELVYENDVPACPFCGENFEYPGKPKYYREHPKHCQIRKALEWCNQDGI